MADFIAPGYKIGREHVYARQKGKAGPAFSISIIRIVELRVGDRIVNIANDSLTPKIKAFEKAGGGKLTVVLFEDLTRMPLRPDKARIFSDYTCMIEAKP